MNGMKYSEWASHYDPQNIELKTLIKHQISFVGKKVLEIGCGTGRFTNKIIRECKEITCIDPDSNALSILCDSISDTKMNVINGTLETVRLKDDYYDYVIFPWSMYLIPNQNEVLLLSLKYLKPNGKLIVLQAMSGEYEEEIAKLYSSYDSMEAYHRACLSLPNIISNVFGSVTTDVIKTYFEFESIDQVIDCSLFFIEDEEGKLPAESAVQQLKERLKSYMTSQGTIVMTDNVSLIIAEKKEQDEFGKLYVGLEVKQIDTFTLFSCCIKNIGNIPIGLQNTYLYIDQGVYNPDTRAFEFPFLQQKFLGIEGIADEDCIGCALCRKGVKSYPLQYSHLKQFYEKFDEKVFCQCYSLDHLSSKSILYVAPNETFTEELVAKLEKGVYRAILMCVPNSETCDCMCCNRCFCIT